MTTSQQQEITEIINMFLDLKPVNEIAAKLIPRQLSYIIKQFKKINRAQLDAITQEYPSPLSQYVENKFRTKNPSMDDIRTLMKLITDNRRILRSMKDGPTQDI